MAKEYAVDTDDATQHYDSRAEADKAKKAFKKRAPGAWVQTVEGEKRNLPPERLRMCRTCDENPVDKPTPASIARAKAKLAGKGKP